MNRASEPDRAILRFTPDGKTAVVTRLGMFWSPIAMTLSGDDLYVLVNLLHQNGFQTAPKVGPPVLHRDDDRDHAGVAATTN